MNRMLAIFLVNLAVVIAISANGVVTLATGCSLGGNCSIQPGIVTWGLAVGPALLLLTGTLWIMRSAKSAVFAVPDRADAALPISGDVGDSSAAIDTVDSVDVEGAGRDRLSRMVAFNNRVADEAISDKMVEHEASPDHADDAAAFASHEELAETARDDRLVTTGPALVASPVSVSTPNPADNWMWLIDPARPHHLAANAVTGFPWVAGVIDLFVTALADDPHFAGDANAQAEAAAWLEITAPMPVDVAIEPTDGQSFVDWANSHIGDKGHLLTPLLSAAMADLRAEAMSAPELAAALPAAFRQPDRNGLAPLAMAS